MTATALLSADDLIGDRRNRGPWHHTGVSAPGCELLTLIAAVEQAVKTTRARPRLAVARVNLARQERALSLGEALAGELSAPVCVYHGISTWHPDTEIKVADRLSVKFAKLFERQTSSRLITDWREITDELVSLCRELPI